MSNSNSTLKSTPAFQVNDRVEAFWRDDGEWHPAEVLKVVPNKGFRIRFDGYVEEYDWNMQDLRVPGQGSARAGGGAAAPPAASAKEAAAAPGNSKHNRTLKNKKHKTDPARDDRAQMQRQQSQAAAAIGELKAQIERLTSELSSSQAEAASSRRDAENARRDLRAAEQQASDDRAQMQREQSQAAAAIGELKAQVERLTSELSSIAVSALQAFQDECNAIAESHKQRLKTAAPVDHLCHRVPSTAAHAAHAAAAGEGSASSTTMTPEAIKKMSPNDIAVLATERAGIASADTADCVRAVSDLEFSGRTFKKDWQRSTLLKTLAQSAYFQTQPAHRDNVIEALVTMKAEAESAATAGGVPPVPSTAAHAADAAAAGEGSASSTTLTPEAMKAMSSNSMAVLATERAGIATGKCIPAVKKILKGVSVEEWSPDRLRPLLEGNLFFQLHPEHVEPIVNALVGMRAEAESAATAAPTAQAEAAAQHESRSVDERAQAPVSDKLHDSRTSEEQVRQTLAVQHCGS